MRIAVVISVAVALLLGSALAHAQSITISITSNASGISLAGSGTSSTSFSAGTVSRTGGSLPIGLSRTTTSSDWTLSTPFDVTVTKDGGLTSASYTLSAQTSTADSVRTWRIDSVALNSVTDSTLAVSDSYDEMVQHTFEVTIPDDAASGAFSNTITLFAVSN